MEKDLIGGMTQEELAKAVSMCVAAFKEHVAETGVDPLAEFYAKAKVKKNSYVCSVLLAA